MNFASTEVVDLPEYEVVDEVIEMPKTSAQVAREGLDRVVSILLGVDKDTILKDDYTVSKIKVVKDTMGLHRTSQLVVSGVVAGADLQADSERRFIFDNTVPTPQFMSEEQRGMLGDMAVLQFGVERVVTAPTPNRTVFHNYEFPSVESV